jgi:hypothetical protein
MDRPTRIGYIEHAAAELLESETNASLRIGVRGRECDRLVITAAGCSVVVALEHRGAVLLTVAALQGRQARGPRVLAAGCEYALRAIHRLSDDFVPTVAFDNPANAARFRERVR